jgi:hypothetical protein
MKRLLTALDDTKILLLLALCGTSTHILLNAQYGFHRDELDCLVRLSRKRWEEIK